MGAEVGVRPPTPRRRLHRRHWLTPAVLAAIVLVIAVTGGFRAAPPVGVRTFALGQPVDLQRWELAVTGVELVDTTSYGSPRAPALRVFLVATWTGDRSEHLLGAELVGLAVPGGPEAEPQGTTVPSTVTPGASTPMFPTRWRSTSPGRPGRTRPANPGRCRPRRGW